MVMLVAAVLGSCKSPSLDGESLFSDWNLVVAEVNPYPTEASRRDHDAPIRLADMNGVSWIENSPKGYDHPVHYELVKVSPVPEENREGDFITVYGCFFIRRTERSKLAGRPEWLADDFGEAPRGPGVCCFYFRAKVLPEPPGGK